MNYSFIVGVAHRVDPVGIKTKDNPKIKTYCYKSECKVIETGFHLEKYNVCTICKEEVSDGLKSTIDSRNKDKEPAKTVEDEWDDQQYSFPFILP